MKLAFPVATPETHDETMLALRGELEANFDRLAELGYHGVELMVRQPAELDAAGIRSAARARSLQVVAVSTGQLRKEDGLQLCALDRDARERAISRGREVIEFAAALGAPQVNVGMFRGTLPAADAMESARRAGTEAFAALVAHAHARGVAVAVEPQSRFVVNWLNTVEETLTWIDGFAGPGRPRILFDAYHAMLEERSIAASLIRAMPHVSYVQVADSNRLAPGQGHLPLADFVRVLRALGYQGFLGVEVLQKPSGLAAATAAALALRPLLDEP